MRASLGQALVPVADVLRGLLTTFGLRPYVVRLMRTRWSSGERGVGVETIIESTILEPTPKIADLTGVAAISTPAGLSEQGEVILSRISGRYTEEQLRGMAPSGLPVEASDSFFYEVEFPRPSDGRPSERRRFTLSSAPYYDPFGLQWRVQLRRQRDDRERNGDLPP